MYVVMQLFIHMTLDPAVGLVVRIPVVIVDKVKEVAEVAVLVIVLLEVVVVVG